jgi:hypothetical protein
MKLTIFNRSSHFTQFPKKERDRYGELIAQIGFGIGQDTGDGIFFT